MSDDEKRARPARLGAFQSLVPGPDRGTVNHDHADIHQTIRRATEILEFVWAELYPVKLARIARGVGLERSTVLRLLHSLEELGYVHRDEADKTYALGFMAQRLGSRRELLRVNVILTDKFICELAGLSGQSVAMASQEGTSVIYHSVRKGVNQPAFVSPTEGTAYPAHACAAGISLLGGQKDEEIRRLYAETTLDRPASRAVQSVQQLIGRVQQSRLQGFALEQDEAVEGRSAIAVPVVNSRGVANMAIVVLGQTSAFNGERVDWLLRSCTATVKRIYDHVLG